MYLVTLESRKRFSINIFPLPKDLTLKPRLWLLLDGQSVQLDFGEPRVPLPALGRQGIVLSGWKASAGSLEARGGSSHSLLHSKLEASLGCTSQTATETKLTASREVGAESSRSARMGAWTVSPLPPHPCSSAQHTDISAGANGSP